MPRHHYSGDVARKFVSVISIPSCIGSFAFSSICCSGVSILFQTLLFGLTAYKFFTAVRAGWGEIPLIVLLMRDGTWAFAVLFRRFSYTLYVSSNLNHDC